MQFSGKKVVVTGVTRGIGQAIAKMLIEQGAYVIGTHTGNDSIKKNNCNELIKADFSNLDEIRSCAEYICKVEPDILINNAGINKISPFIKIDSADFLLIQQVNLFAPFSLCQAVIPGMQRKGWGRITNISSIWGKISKEFRASYSASKFALDGMTLALAAEHAADGILVNCVAPGFTNTELTRKTLTEDQINKIIATVPIRRMAKVDEIAHFVVWLCSNENTYLTGQNIAIDGGFSRV